VTAPYTFDVFATLDGFGSYDEHGDWGGFWGKQGPEFLEHRLALLSEDQRMVYGARTYEQMLGFVGPDAAGAGDDPLAVRMATMPLTVVSSTLEEPLAWAHADLGRGDAVDVVTRLKRESAVPLVSHGSLSLNRSLLAAGLVDRIRVTVFPVLSGRTGTRPVFAGVEDFDLELLEARTLDGRIQELVYRPTRHG
jgi:dihydrofolate reductase